MTLNIAKWVISCIDLIMKNMYLDDLSPWDTKYITIEIIRITSSIVDYD